MATEYENKHCTSYTKASPVDHFIYNHSKGYSCMARPLLSCRGVITFGISAPHEKESGTLPLAYLSQPCTPSGMLGINCLPIKHRYLLLHFIRNN